MITIECDQYSPIWWAERIKKPTASNFKKIVDTKGNPSKSADGYMYQLAIENITNKYAGNEFNGRAMRRGLELEPDARELFELIKNVEVKQVGLIYADEQKKYSASPDGLFEDTGLEIYCPESPSAGYCFTHPDKAIKHAVKYQQIQGTMFIGGFKRYYFMCFYPDMMPLIIEVHRDEKFISALAKQLDKFVDDLIRTIKKLKGGR
jgi:hypothetical protein